ncbi:MAG: methyl-accepting chemotaxis protein [Pseudomonadota bacterium]
MAKSLDIDNPAIGRFDKSFLIHMIKDFFVILVIVTVLEFGVKVGLVYWDFHSNGAEDAREAAEEIADNVISIMLNEGGPVAARTLYPILEENWSQIGYSIAVEPSEVTRTSIMEGFGFLPMGIPATDWPEGTHRAAEIEVVAQDFCLACHTQAAVGDVLGRVEVRTYLASDLLLWWKDIQLTAGLAVGKILLHSILLYGLLRARLEPLIALRSVVSNLARAYGGLDHRAEIRSSDEFGALARDLNLFLDRISRLLGELDDVLSRVVRVNDDILEIQGRLRGQVDCVIAQTRQLEREALKRAGREPRLSPAWFEAMTAQIDILDQRLEGSNQGPRVGEVLKNLREVTTLAEAQVAQNESLFESLTELGEETEAFQSAMAEMVRLEERLKSIVESGSTLVARLRPETSAQGT